MPSRRGGRSKSGVRAKSGGRRYVESRSVRREVVLRPSLVARVDWQRERYKLETGEFLSWNATVECLLEEATGWEPGLLHPDTPRSRVPKAPPDAKERAEALHARLGG